MVAELAAEQPDGDHAVDQQAAHGDRLGQQSQIAGPVGAGAGQLSLLAEQSQRAGASGVGQDEHEQAADECDDGEGERVRRELLDGS
ncbi:hypothetical protein ACFSKW_49985 [Nonomuraea mangrovi]|uniref:Uncharacterized protein n=1 Tax=Nonomuraea mangrovi TaxID=2316207 RepID=A0ABW4TEZ2_9ACTN